MTKTFLEEKIRKPWRETDDQRRRDRKYRMVNTKYSRRIVLWKKECNAKNTCYYGCGSALVRFGLS